MADLDYEGFWTKTLLQLRNDLREEEFSGWFSNMKYLRHSVSNAGETSIVVGIPSAFHRDKVNTIYSNSINSILKKVSGKDIAFEMEITSKSNKKAAPQAQSDKEDDNVAVKIEKTPKTKEKREQHPDMRDDYTFDRYVKGENNDFAVNAAHAISKNPGKSYNPLLIYGDVGVGKTHLMQAIGNHVHENSENRVIFITSENFLNEYLEGIRQDAMKVFKNKYRQTDVLLIDDIQFLTNKPGVQEELFHTFNALLDAKKQLVFTCDRPISELKNFSDRLISRFELGVKADLQPPRYEERCVILRSAAQNRGINLPDEVIDLIGKNISSNVRDLISALNNLIAYAELMGKPITVEAAQKHLKNIFNAPRQSRLSMDNIIRVIAEDYGLTPNDLRGKKRTHNITFARQLAMFVGREMTDYSTTELGQDFGGRDHTTVMHSISKIRDKLLTDPALGTKIDSLKRAVIEFSAKH